MIKEVSATGATIDEAIAEAKKLLAAPDEADVTVEIIEMPQKKTLGLFGGKEAKARAWYETPDEKPEKVKPAAKTPKTAKPETAKPDSPKPAPKKDIKNERFAENKAEKVEATPPAELKDVPKEEIAPLIRYLEIILAGLGLEKSTISAKASENELVLSIECEEDHGILIGRRGETLDCVQYLLRLFLNRDKSNNRRVTINVGGYREKRENNLKSLADRTASQVLRYGRKVSLEPMNPYERRIIHTAIQDIKGVSSYSVGSDSERHVVVALQEGFTPGGRGGRPGGNNNGGRGGYNNNSRDNSRDRGRGPKPAYNSGKDNNESRSPTKDAQSVSLYGKIK